MSTKAQVRARIRTLETNRDAVTSALAKKKEEISPLVEEIASLRERLRELQDEVQKQRLSTLLDNVAGLDEANVSITVHEDHTLTMNALDRQNSWAGVAELEAAGYEQKRDSVEFVDFGVVMSREFAPTTISNARLRW